MRCQSYNPNGFCKDGFPIGYPASSACTGSLCSGCGRHGDKIPACQDEDLGKTWLNDDGTPRHYMEQQP